MASNPNGPCESSQARLDLRPSETLGEALARIRADSGNEAKKGKWFETLARQFLTQEPTFEVQNIWTWRDWPEREELTGLDGRDMGIDLVARLHGGEWVAVQCKFYAEHRRISRKDIDGFLAESAREPFAKRWLVVTCKWGRGAEQAVAGKLLIPVHRIDFMDYADREVLEVAKPSAPFFLDGKRLEAVEAVVDGLETQRHDRGKLIMACGTGKTFVSLKVAERLVPDAGRVLFAAPSIALVSQARKAWLTHTERPLRSLVVCSDAGAGGGGESDRAGLDDLVCPVATSPERIAEHLRGGGGVRAVFSTYQSLNKVIAAQQTSPDLVFDLAVADEAHRTVGVEGDKDKAFQDFHRADALKCRKRLYMTATPRIYSPASVKRLKTRQARGTLGATSRFRVYDMSDPKVFGRQLYRLKFKEAVEAGMLSDYRVIVLGVRSEWVTASLARLVEANHKVVTPSDATRLLGVSLAINGHIQGDMEDAPRGPLGRSLAFANTIARSKWYAETINDPELRKRTTRRIRMDRGQDAQAAMHVVAEHLDGSDSALKRNRGLRALRDGGASPYECRMVCNAKLFAEGVDVPQLDSVVFLDARKSHIDIVQAVGRVMRKSRGKRFGYIILPIALQEGESIVDALAADRDGFKVVGDVLRALQSHDERLADNVAHFVRVVDPPSVPLPRDDSADGETNGHELNDQLPLLLFDSQVYAKISAAFGLSGRQRGRVTADWIEMAVNAAAGILARDECEGALAEALKLHGIQPKNLYKIASLILCNALLMHKRLLDAIEISDVEPLDAIVRRKAPADGLIPSWEEILKRDYAPIFAPALAVLVSLRTGPNANEAVSVLADCADTVADSLSEMGYDHAGPLYHRILPSAQSDGAYYTHNVSAVLLARLAVDDDIADWSDVNSVTGLRIIDPACGTGTLLMAALKTIKERAIKGRALTEDNVDEAHKHLVESSIRGLDINWHALQLAASNLTLGAPTVDYKAMHLHAMEHGPADENGGGGGGGGDYSARSGSLELIPDLIARRRPDLLAASSTATLTADFVGAEQVAAGRDLDLRDMDVVLMNPPFSINTGSSAKFGVEGQRKMRSREDWILETMRQHDPEAANAITRKTLRTFFTPLADSLLRRDRGVLAKVLPFAASVSSTGARERRFLADRFEVSIVVTSHVGSFSAATSIHECLLVCRRRPKKERRDTLFAALCRMPETADEAVEVAEQIRSGRLASKWGACCRWPRERVEAGDWSASQWMDGVLAEAAHSMSALPGLRPLGALAEVGPAHVRSDMRNPLGDPSDGPYRVLWRHRTKERRTMRSVHEFTTGAKPDKQREAERAWKKASRLLVGNKLRMTVGHVTAVLLDSPAVGSAWTPASPRPGLTDSSLLVLQAWCAWLNSTPGLLGFLHRRGRTLDYSDFMPNKLNSLPCPDPSQATSWRPLARAYEELRHQPLEPWPRMDECPVRATLDDVAAEAVGLNRETVADWRRRLVHEPTIGGDRAVRR